MQFNTTRLLYDAQHTHTHTLYALDLALYYQLVCKRVNKCLCFVCAFFRIGFYRLKLKDISGKRAQCTPYIQGYYLWFITMEMWCNFNTKRRRWCQRYSWYVDEKVNSLFPLEIWYDHNGLVNKYIFYAVTIW